jgi:type I restriction enzyme, S subunit
MDLTTFIDNFDLVAEAPNGIPKLREMILQLAVRGKLVPQDANDLPASQLLKRITAEKERLIAEGKIKRAKPLPAIDPDELPYVVPRSWVWSRLSDLGTINPRNEASDDVEAGFIPMSLISEKYGVQPHFEVRRWEDIKRGFTHFAEGDVAVAKITPCFQNGKSGVFRGLPNDIGAGTTELHVFRPIKNTAVPDYVWLYLKTPRFLLDGECQMTGSAGQKRVSKGYFAGNPFPLPPLAEQKRIVDKVDELMALCDELEEQKKRRKQISVSMNTSCLHELTSSEPATSQKGWSRIRENFDLLYDTPDNVAALRKSVLQLAVMGKLVPQDPNEEPASELLKRITAEKERLIAEAKIKKSKPLTPIEPEKVPYELPDSWKWVRFETVFCFIDYRGKTPLKADSGIRLVTAKNIRMGYLQQDPREYVTQETYRKWMTRGYPSRGDLLFTTEAPMGNVCLVNFQDRFALAQRVINLHPYGYPESKYLMYAIMSPDVQKLITDRATGSTATGIKAAKLKQVPLPLPPLAEQNRIVAKVDELMALCNALETKLRQSSNVSEMLMSAVVEKIIQC